MRIHVINRGLHDYLRTPTISNYLTVNDNALTLFNLAEARVEERETTQNLHSAIGPGHSHYKLQKSSNAREWVERNRGATRHCASTTRESGMTETYEI